MYNVRDFGAVPDGQTNDTGRIQSAIDAAAAGGGGRVVVPPGNYVTGTLWMRSNITLDIEAGATLLGSQNPNDFPMFKSKWEGPGIDPARAALIAGQDLHNVSLVGRGIINARGKMWWDLAHKDKSTVRPLLFRLIHSENILVQGLTFINSPMWTISPLACTNVTINGITIQNPWNSPNTDGINPDSCSDVHVSNCYIDVGDDCVTIKSGTEDDGRREHLPCQNVTVTNCTMVHGHGGVVFGSETTGSIRNIVISNCVFIGTDRGLRFKSRRGRGGVVEDVSANNIIMDGVLCPFPMNLFYGSGAKGAKRVEDQTVAYPVNDTTPKFRRFRFSNIIAKNVKYAAAYIQGLPELPIDDVSFDNVTFVMDATNKKAGRPAMAPKTPSLSRAGFIAHNISHLTLRNVQIEDQTGPAVQLFDASDVRLTDVSPLTPGTGAMFDLDNVRNTRIQGCDVPAGTSIAVKITGNKTDHITLDHNDFSSAGKIIQAAGGLSTKIKNMDR